MAGRRPARETTRVVVLFIAALIFSVVVARLQAQPALFDNGPSVLRVYYEDFRSLTRLSRFDLWEYNNLAERYVLVATDAVGESQLMRRGWRVAPDPAATAEMRQSPGPIGRLKNGYRTLDELYADLATAAAGRPELIELVTYGQSYCLERGGCAIPGGAPLDGYPLQAIRVTNEAVAGSSTIAADGTVTRGQKPVFFLMAGIHAREITTPELAMRFFDLLLDGYGVDADVTWLVDNHEIWIAPMVNPDGRWLVELGERPEYGGRAFYQRKNANNDGDSDGAPDCDSWPPSAFEPGAGPQFGIDLNRNHSFGWGGLGSSSAPCDLTYRGAGPASESEVAQLETLVRALVADQRGPGLDDAAPDDTTGLLITLHSFSNLVLYPWGNIYHDAPNDTGLKAIADRMAAYNDYLSCQPTECLYAASGATDDWAYGELGIPAFTFEIGDQFMPPYDVIDAQQWPENRPALLYAAKIARTPYVTALGPDVVDVVVSGIGPARELTATISDYFSGGQRIAYAAYTIDTPPWQPGVPGTALAPADGIFDATLETVGGLVDVSAVAPGRHLLYIRGQDVEGHWGPVTAAFLDVARPGMDQSVFLPFLRR